MTGVTFCERSRFNFLKRFRLHRFPRALHQRSPTSADAPFAFPPDLLLPLPNNVRESGAVDHRPAAGRTRKRLRGGGPAGRTPTASESARRKAISDLLAADRREMRVGRVAR